MPAGACRQITFTIQNQGEYDETGKIKKDFLEWAKIAFNIKSYLIVQEQNLEDQVVKEYIDTHLQGSLYFTDQVRIGTINKKFAKQFKATKTEAGTIGRFYVAPIHKGTETRMNNYFKSVKKAGMDPNPLSDLLAITIQKEDKLFNDEFNRVIMGAIKADIERRNLSLAKLRLEEFEAKGI